MPGLPEHLVYGTARLLFTPGFFIDLIGPMSIFSPLAFFSFAALRGDLRRYLCINHRSLLLRFSELPLNQLTDLDICFFLPPLIHLAP